MYYNDVGTMAQPGATRRNVSINLKELKGHNIIHRCCQSATDQIEFMLKAGEIKTIFRALRLNRRTYG